jgi:N-acetylneuraminate synthase
MKTMQDAFMLPVGYSDHSMGIVVPTAATALGAVVIEKHLSLDRTLTGPDHSASLEPKEFNAMVQAIRQVELCLGQATKCPQISERRNQAVARKSLIAKCDIKKGETLSPQNIDIMRPGTGITPMLFWDFIGREALQDYAQGEIIRG